MRPHGSEDDDRAAHDGGPGSLKLYLCPHLPAGSGGIVLQPGQECPCGRPLSEHEEFAPEHVYALRDEGGLLHFPHPTDDDSTACGEPADYMDVARDDGGLAGVWCGRCISSERAQR